MFVCTWPREWLCSTDLATMSERKNTFSVGQKYCWLIFHVGPVVVPSLGCRVLGLEGLELVTEQQGQATTAGPPSTQD